MKNAARLRYREALDNDAALFDSSKAPPLKFIRLQVEADPNSIDASEVSYCMSIRSALD